MSVNLLWLVCSQSDMGFLHSISSHDGNQFLLASSKSIPPDKVQIHKQNPPHFCSLRTHPWRGSESLRSKVPLVSTMAATSSAGEIAVSSEEKVYNVVLKQAALVNRRLTPPDVAAVPGNLSLLKEAYDRCAESSPLCYLLQCPIPSLSSHPYSNLSISRPFFFSFSPSLRVFAMAEAPASPGGGSHESGEQSPRSNVREQDRYLPIANISRIMKKALPANGKIAKDAKETVQECVSEFISFITSEASDKCQKEKRKTINGDDLLWAMATLGFEDYIDPLKIYLSRYREMEGDTKSSAKGGDASAKKDVQPSQNVMLAHQGSFSGFSYGNSQ